MFDKTTSKLSNLENTTDKKIETKDQHIFQRLTFVVARKLQANKKTKTKTKDCIEYTLVI